MPTATESPAPGKRALTYRDAESQTPFRGGHPFHDFAACKGHPPIPMRGFSFVGGKEKKKDLPVDVRHATVGESYKAQSSSSLRPSCTAEAKATKRGQTTRPRTSATPHLSAPTQRAKNPREGGTGERAWGVGV